MAGRRKSAGSASLYESITARSQTVNVNGVDVVLSVPSREIAEAVRNERVKLAKTVHDRDDPDLTQAAEYMLQVAALCVKACWPEGIGAEAARHLVVISGGEQGALAAATMRLCGCANDDREEAELDRPS